MSNPSQEIVLGASLLSGVLGSRFTFSIEDVGKGSGGNFATGTFNALDRSLAFSVRYGLGLVTYSVGTAVIEHGDLLKYAGLWGAHKYPNFGGSIEDSFLALADDLKHLLGNFVSGDGSLVREAADLKAKAPNKFKGFGALGQR